MSSQPTQSAASVAVSSSAADQTPLSEADLSLLVASPNQALAEALPADLQVRTLRVLDTNAALAAEHGTEVLSEIAPESDVLVLEAELPLAEIDPILHELYLERFSAHEEHSQAAPPPLTEPGEVIDLLSGTEVLSAIDALAPFELPAGLHDDSSFEPSSHADLAQTFGDTPSDLIFLDYTSFSHKPNHGGGGGDGGGGNGGGKGGGKGGGNDGGGNDGTVKEYLSGDPTVDDSNEFNILIDFKGEWTADLQDAFTWAADWISSVITGDVGDVFYRGNVIDDIVITAELTAIDGEGGILGQAGPTAVRTGSYLPAAGIMEFDSADAAYYDSLSLWDDIVVHEMLHTIGFGTVWDFLGLVDGSGTSNPTFNGTEATLAYADIFGGSGNVPLEYGYGSGTDESHWDEAAFSNEIMTGFINYDSSDPTASNYMSGMTVASLTDLGYDTIDWDTEFTEFTV